MAARDYQILAAQSIWDYYTAGNVGNPLILMPTGTGKSHVLAEFLQSVLRFFPTQRIQVLTHVKELIEQNHKKLLDAWPNAPAGIYSAGLQRKDIHNNIIFGGIASVARKAHAFGHVDLLLIDEAHLVSTNDKTQYHTYINALKKVNPLLKVIGLTATGWRTGSGKLVEEEDPLFTDVCFDMTTIEAFNWLFEQGYLLPVVPKKTRVELDVSGVHTRGGEFIQAELQNAVDKHDITVKALQEAIQAGENRRKWLIFAAGVEHAMHIADILNELGIPAGAVHSRMSGQERDRVLADHKAGRIRAIANNNILTTGYDDPEIDLILCLRPTASSVLWVQMLGRGTRPVFAPGYDLSTQAGRLAAIAASQKQDCLVLDYSGNTRRLGPINDPVIPGKKGKGSGPAPVKCCDNCDTYNHASARFCFVCGAEFTFAVKIKQAASTEDLIKGGELPVVEVFAVQQITYQQHYRAGKPMMMRVSYYCGLRKFDEYVCLEHMDFAGKRARDWWRKRSTLPVPPSVAAALSMTDLLKQPTHLRIWVNKRYPEILDVDFTGTQFGASEAVEPPVVTVGSRDALPELDDDRIPFDSPGQAATANNDEIPF